ncbi:hypothetical protein MRB53_005822 [Persea americana]|uniref:Uncharacterized protein n=1 Tax=Persea americana TaxID=3435 RepID=A0ACC2MEN3_PERAE|nr:hypothetical protein MRB53_005822 [Persea americana]
MPQKLDFKKITGTNHREKRKESEKRTFRRKSYDPDFQGHWRPWGRQPWAMVSGDHGPRSPATLDFGPFSGRLSVAVSRAFSLLFSPVFFLKFLLIYWLNSSEEKLSIGCANQSTKFPIFGKAEDSVADFSPRVETRSNDVGMT